MSHPSGTRMIESNMTEFGSFYTELANLQTSDKISYQPTRPATIRKRSREIPLLSVSAASDQDRASKIMRWEDQLDCASSSPGDTNPTNHQMAQGRSPTNRHMSDSRNLSEIQKTFIRHWFESFADGESHGFATHETINALATLVQASPQPIFDYINREFSPQSNRSVVGVSINRLVSDASSYDRNELTGRSSWSNSFMELNRHLPPATLALVEKYVSACRRRRPQTDGRRSVNDGPFRCTFGCGYQTKRAFDWRRHEETHEPQELWLCTLCSQNMDQSPLLVNRKDKFLKHAKDGHPAWEPETVLDMSRVDFKPRFDPSCPFCADATSKTWDERCRHVLEHFEVGTEVIPQSTSRKEYKERKRQSI